VFSFLENQKWMHLFGNVVAFIGVCYVFYKLFNISADFDFKKLNIFVILVMIGVVIVSSVANVLLSLSWKLILNSFGSDLSYSRAFIIYSISQIAKYVPGNIFHLAGRQVLCLSEGISSSHVIKSIFVELILISSTGALFIFLVLPYISSGMNNSQAVCLFLSSIAFVYLLLRKFRGTQISLAFLLQGGFLFISGMLFAVILNLISSKGLTTYQITPIIGSYVIAWLVGLITPGAPAGVGVREIVLSLILKDTIIEEDLYYAIFLGRVISVLADTLFYSSGILFRFMSKRK
jgi:hypothetical protein